MHQKQKGARIKPKNLAAQALGDKQFSAKVVEKKQHYSRKTKFSKGRFDVDQSPFCFVHVDGPFIFCNV